jgi:arylsulfatase A-like enzyme
LRNFLHSPNLDQLTTEGTLFRNAFCTAPICTPARASLLTGAWPSTHGSFSIPSAELNRPARQELPVLTRLLADHGYRVAWTGKYHGELASPPSPE